MNRLLLLLLGALGLAALAFSYSKRSDCFSPDFIESDSTFYLDSPPFPKEAERALSQPFHFLGSGNQAYAFVSEDQKYVLKLFKFHCLKDLPAKRDRLKQGLLVAKDHANSSGIIFVHFPPTPAGQVHLTDKAGRKHDLLLDKLVFVIQEKARPLGSILKDHFNRGDTGGAKSKLAKLFTMFRENLEQGVYDQDHNVIANTGFVEERPMRIDFGKLTIDHSIDTEQELKKIASERILPWTKRNFPQFEKEIAQFLENIL